MRALLLGGLLALCVLMAAAQTEKRSKEVAAQSKNDGTPRKKKDHTGVWSSILFKRDLSEVSGNLRSSLQSEDDEGKEKRKKLIGEFILKRSVRQEPKKRTPARRPPKNCPGCFSSLLFKRDLSEVSGNLRSSLQSEDDEGKEKSKKLIGEFILKRSVRQEPKKQAPASRRRKKCPGCFSSLDVPRRVVRHSEGRNGKKKNKNKSNTQIGRRILTPEEPDADVGDERREEKICKRKDRKDRKDRKRNKKKKDKNCRKEKDPNMGEEVVIMPPGISSPVGGTAPPADERSWRRRPGEYAVLARSREPEEAPGTKSASLMVNDEPDADVGEERRGEKTGKRNDRKDRKDPKREEEVVIIPGKLSPLGGAVPPADESKQSKRNGRRRPGGYAVMSQRRPRKQNPFGATSSRGRRDEPKKPKKNKGSRSGGFSPIGRKQQEQTDLEEVLSRLPPKSAEKQNQFGASSSRGKRDKPKKPPTSSLSLLSFKSQPPKQNQFVASSSRGKRHREDSEGEGKPWRHKRRHGGEERRRWRMKENSDPTMEHSEGSEGEGRPWRHERRHHREERRRGRKREHSDPENLKETLGEKRHWRHHGEERRRGWEREDTDPTTEVKEEGRRWGRGHRHHHHGRRGEWRRQTDGQSLIRSPSLLENQDVAREKELEPQI